MSTWTRRLSIVLMLGLITGACSNGSGSKSRSPVKERTTDESLFSPEEINAPQHVGTPVRGGSIKFGLEGAVLNYSPNQNVIQPPDLQVVTSVFDALVSFDENNEPVGHLAESVTGSKDFKTWTVKLRKGVKFSNGVGLDADQVVSHTEWAKATPTCSCATDADNIESVVAQGEDTIIYTLETSNVAWPTKLSSGLGWITEKGAREAAADPANPDMLHLIGTGAFVFSSRNGDQFTVVRNTHYWGTDPLNDDAALPYLDQITFQPLADATTRLAAVRSNGVQIMQTAETATLVSAVKDPKLVVQPITGASATILILNLSQPPFGVKPKTGESASETVERSLADPTASAARRAFALAINRNEINQKYYQGTRIPAYGWVAPDSPYFNPEGQLPRYDPDEARKLVKQVKDAGVDFTVNSICIPGPEASGVFNILGPQLESVGITAGRKTVDQAVLVQTLIMGRATTATANWNNSCFRSAQLADPDALYNGLHSTGVGNTNHYTNAKVDEALTKGRGLSGVEARKPYYDTVQAQVAADIVNIPLLYDLSGNVHRADLSGLGRPSPTYLGLIPTAGLYRTR